MEPRDAACDAFVAPHGFDKTVRTVSDVATEVAGVSSVFGTPGQTSRDSAADQTQTSILEMWWSLVQDQVGALGREVESLRMANSQMQARFADILTCRTEATFHSALESNKTAFIGQEVQRLQAELQMEKEERISEAARVLDAVKGELKRHAGSIVEQLQQDRAELRETLCQDLRVEVQQFREKTVEDVAFLKQAIDEERTSRGNADEQLAENVRRISSELVEDGTAVKEMKDRFARLMAELDREHQSRSSSHGILQTKVEAMEKSVEAEREEWANRRGNLLGRILHHISEQEQNAKQERHLHERFLEQQKAELQQLVVDSCAKERQATKALADRAQQILDTDETLRQKITSLLTQVMSSKAATQQAQQLMGETPRAVSPTRAAAQQAQQIMAETPRAVSPSRVPSVITRVPSSERWNAHRLVPSVITRAPSSERWSAHRLEGMRTAVTNADVTSSGALQRIADTIHRSCPSSAATLPPMGDDVRTAATTFLSPPL